MEFEPHGEGACSGPLLQRLNINSLAPLDMRLMGKKPHSAQGGLVVGHASERDARVIVAVQVNGVPALAAAAIGRAFAADAMAEAVDAAKPLGVHAPTRRTALSMATARLGSGGCSAARRTTY